MVIHATPYKAVAKAADCIRRYGYNPDELSIDVEERDDSWKIYFCLLNRRMRGGDVEVRIAKDSLDVVEVLRYQ